MSNEQQNSDNEPAPLTESMREWLYGAKADREQQSREPRPPYAVQTFRSSLAKRYETNTDREAFERLLLDPATYQSKQAVDADGSPIIPGKGHEVASWGCPLFSPGLRRSGQRRGEVPSTFWYAVVEHDKGAVSFDEAVEALQKAGVDAIVYTSASHSPEQPRWRVVAPLQTPCDVDAYLRHLDTLNGVLGGVCSPECADPTRQWFFGRVRDTAEHFRSARTSGRPLDTLAGLPSVAFPREEKRAPRERGSAPIPVSLQRLASACDFLDPNDYEYFIPGRFSWLTAVNAIKYEAQQAGEIEAGREILHRFSSRFTQRHGYNPAETDLQYDFSKAGCEHPVTGASILAEVHRIAQATGRVWADPAHAPNADGFEDLNAKQANELLGKFILGDGWSDSDAATLATQPQVIDRIEEVSPEAAAEARALLERVNERARETPGASAENAKAITFDYRAFDRIIARPAEQQWVWNHWLPRGHVTTLFGRGGVGKTLFAQQIATHVALGEPLLGAGVAQGRTLAFLCEDDGETLDRRQWDICVSMSVPIGETAGRVLIESRLGKDNILATFNRERVATATGLLRAIEAEVAKHRPVLVVVDNIAQVYAGDPNAAGEVTQFVNLLSGIARRYGCAVLVLGHVARAEGSEYAGSAAWENAVRSRLLFQRDANDPDLIRIVRAKANYAALEDATIRYKAGYFIEVTAEQQAQERREAADDLKPALLAAAERFVAQGERLSASTRAASCYLPRLAEDRGLIPKGSVDKGRGPADVALRDLIDVGELITIPLPWKVNRKREEGLVPARFRWLQPVIDAAGTVAVMTPRQIAEAAVEAEGLRDDEKALHEALRAVAEGIRRGLLRRAENGFIGTTGMVPVPSAPIGPGDPEFFQMEGGE